MDNTLLETKKLTKRFGEVVAVDAVDLTLHSGEIRGLIGENGSGKSTISSMINGTHFVTSGEMLLSGKPYKPKGPLDAVRHGISMVVQETGTIAELTIAENIFLGNETQFKRFGRIDAKALNAEAQMALSNIGVTDIDVTRAAASYNFEMRKLVEVARAIHLDPELFIVDETTTALSHEGRDIMYRIIREQKQKGRSVLFISHDLNELMVVCDMLTVLRDGKMVETIERTDFDEEKIKRSMVGRVLQGDYYRSDYDGTTGDRETLRVEHITNAALSDVSLILHEGEIIGVGGLSGSGMHEIGRAIFGMDTLASGNVLARNKESWSKVSSISGALKNSIGYISKDRDKETLILPASIKDNLVISAIDRLGKVITPRKEKVFAVKLIEELRIRCSSMNQPVSELSGGNKQKVSFGKWIGNGSKILIMDSPTRGVDVGVKTTMYQLIYRLKKERYSIIIISEELPELIGMCDNILIMKDGAIVRRFERNATLTDTDIIGYML